MSYLESLSGLALDGAIIGAFFALIFLYSFFLGKDKVVSLIYSYYASLLIYISIPPAYINTVLFWRDTAEHVILSRILIFGLILISTHIVTIKTVSSSQAFLSRRKYVGTTLLSLAFTSLILVFCYHVVPVEGIHNFTSLVDKLFAPKILVAWWYTAPLVVVFITEWLKR